MAITVKLMNTLIEKKPFQTGYTKACNHPQPSATTHNHSQPSTKKPPTATYNHPEPFKTTQKLPKKAETCYKQLCYCTLDVNTETDVDLDSDMKQWYIYMCVYVSVCRYFISHHIYYALVRLIVCFCQCFCFCFCV